MKLPSPLPLSSRSFAAAIPFALASVAASAFFVLSAISPFPAAAQTQGGEDGEGPGIQGFWEVVTSSGRFVARLDQIASASEHEYVIDGAVRVYECTIDTVGGQTARFYYLEPVTDQSSLTSGSATANRLREIANQVSERVGTGNLDELVTKHYPDTTHAKTSEYRLKQRETVSQIYNHVRRVWAEERGRGDRNQLVVRNG